MEQIELTQGKLSTEERERILAKEIYKLSWHSYEVEHSTGTAASLVWKRPKGGFAGNLFLTVITLGFWLIIWIPLGVLGDLVTPKRIYLEVLPDGTIEREEKGWR